MIPTVLAMIIMDKFVEDKILTKLAILIQRCQKKRF